MSEAATGGAPASSQESFAPYNPWITAVVVSLATFMEVLDTTIVNVALPHIAGSMSVDVNDSTWVLTSYLVSNAIVLPLSGWASTRFGRKKYYLGCVTLFTLSSLLCGIAPTLGSLVLFRLLQGVGGGGLQPTTQAILVDTFPLKHRGYGMALFGMTVVTAPIIGPTLGGWLTDHYSWRWVFFINLPFGIVSLLLSSKIVQDPPYMKQMMKDKLPRVDYIGLGLLTLGIGSLQMFLDLGERKDWFSSWLILWLAIAAGLGLLLGGLWEWRHDHPVVNLRLLKERNFALATLTMLIFGSVLYGSTVLLPLLTQTLLGYDATTSGLVISPGGVVTLLLMPVIGWLVGWFDARILITIGALAVGFALFIMGHFNLQVGFWDLAHARMVQSFGLAFMFVPVNTIAYAYISPRSRGSASSIISFTRNIGGSIGIAYVSNRLQSQAQVHQVDLVGFATPYHESYREFLNGIQPVLMRSLGDPVAATQQSYALLMRIIRGQSSMMAFIDNFYLLAVAMLFVIPVVWMMKRPPRMTGAGAAH